MYLFMKGCMYGCKGVCLQGNHVCVCVKLNCVFIRCSNITYLGFFGEPDQILKSTELFNGPKLSLHEIIFFKNLDFIANS